MATTGLENGALRIPVHLLILILQIVRFLQLMFMVLIILMLSSTAEVHRKEADQNETPRICFPSQNGTEGQDRNGTCYAQPGDPDSKFLVAGLMNPNSNNICIALAALMIPSTFFIMITTFLDLEIPYIKIVIPLFLMVNAFCMGVVQFFQWQVLFCSKYVAKMIVTIDNSVETTLLMSAARKVAPLDSDMNCQAFHFSWPGVLALISTLGFAVDAVFSYQIRHVLDDEYDDDSDEEWFDEEYEDGDLDQSRRSTNLGMKTKIRGLTRNGNLGRVTIEPVGLVAHIPSSPNATKARKSFKKIRGASTYDKRRKESVHEVIYNIGGHILDPKNKNRKIKIYPGTRKPGKLMAMSSRLMSTRSIKIKVESHEED